MQVAQIVQLLRGSLRLNCYLHNNAYLSGVNSTVTNVTVVIKGKFKGKVGPSALPSTTL
jgi:hypothetical protein